MWISLNEFTYLHLISICSKLYIKRRSRIKVCFDTNSEFTSSKIKELYANLNDKNKWRIIKESFKVPLCAIILIWSTLSFISISFIFKIDSIFEFKFNTKEFFLIFYLQILNSELITIHVKEVIFIQLIGF